MIRPSRQLIGLLFALFATAGVLHEAGRAAPFSPGERLTYDLYWNFIHAGSAIVEVETITKRGEMSAYRFVLTIRTNRFVAMFYKVRDRIEGVADPAMTCSLLYRKEQREGSYRRNAVVEFDWEDGTARYRDRGKERPSIPVQAGTFDPLSVCYHLRMQPLAVGMEFTAPVCDGKKCVLGKVRVVDRRKIEVKGTLYDTFLIEPELKHLGGVFKRSKTAELKIWLSADGRHIPVKVKSKVKVGSFSALLAGVEGKSD